MKYRRYLSDPVLVRSGFRCSYCDKDLLTDPDTLITFVRDHLIPRSAGGLDAPSNRVASCAACDRLKGAAVVTTIKEAQAVIARNRIGHVEWFRRIRQTVRS